jgi:hypothetical protein
VVIHHFDTLSVTSSVTCDDIDIEIGITVTAAYDIHIVETREPIGQVDVEIIAPIIRIPRAATAVSGQRHELTHNNHFALDYKDELIFRRMPMALTRPRPRAADASSSLQNP